MIITNREREILLYIVMNGPSIGNRISKNRGLSNSTVSTRALSLEKKGLITHKPISTIENPHPHRLLNLTILGLSHALILIRSEELNPIIERWAHLLPLVLKKWKHFTNAGLNDMVRNSLFLTAFEFCKNYWSDVELSKAVEDGLGESWTDMMDLMRPYEELERFQASFYGHLFRFNAILTPKKKGRLVDTCKSDPVIRAYLVDSFMRAKDELRSNVDHAGKVIEVFQQDDKVR